MNQNWEKILKAVKKIGGQKELADRLKIPATTVRNWFSRESIPLELAPHVVIALDNLVTMDDVAGEYMHAIRETKTSYLSASSVNIPLINSEKLTNLNEALRDNKKTIPMDDSFSKPVSQKAFALIAFDESMEPDIKEGDLVIIDPEYPQKPGDIVLACINDIYLLGKYKINQYTRSGVDISIIPSNSFFASISINSENPGSIIGTAFEMRRKLK